MRSPAHGRCAGRPRRRAGGSRAALHADDSRGGDRNARDGAPRRDSLGGLRRIRGERARPAHPARRAESDPHRELRNRTRARRLLSAPSGERAREGEQQTRPLRRGEPARAEGGLCAEGRDLDWEEITQSAKPHPCVPVQASEPLYILYTSGTTGVPKGVVRDNGGHAVALKWSMRNIYAMKPGDVFWAASDIGWVVGHSYIVYAPLLMGCTTVLYEGKPVGTPDASAFWRVVSEHRVNTLFTAPTAMRAIKREDPARGTDAELRPLEPAHALSRGRAGGFGYRGVVRARARCAGDRPLVADRNRLGDRRELHGTRHLFPLSAARPRRPVPGYDVHVLDDDGREVGPGETGTHRRQAAAAAGMS